MRKRPRIPRPYDSITNFQPRGEIYNLSADYLNIFNPLNINYYKSEYKHIHQYALFCRAVYDINSNIYISEAKSKYKFFEKEWNRVKTFEKTNLSPELPFKIPGLKFEIWRNSNSTHYVIVFRGTRSWHLFDWFANLKCITNLIPLIQDHYDIVAEMIPKIAHELTIKYGDNIDIITTGHSLGGGLAQHAAFSTPIIKKAFGFNASPIIECYHLFNNRCIYREDTAIYQIHEHGEILENLRRWKMKFFPLSQANPLIEILQFNRQNNGLLAEHSIESLADDLNMILLENEIFLQNATQLEIATAN